MPLKILEKWKLGEKILDNPKKYNGFLGVSLTSPYHHHVIKDYIEFGNRYFKKFALLPVDVPYQYNYIVFENLSKVKAYEKAIKLGDDLTRFMNKKLVEMKLVDKVEIFRWEKLARDQKFKNILQETYKLLKGNKKFLEDLRDHILKQAPHIEKRLFENRKKLSDIGIEKQKETLYRFLVDEVAMFIYIQEFLEYPIRLSAYSESNITRNIYKGGEYNNIYERLNLSGQIGHIKLEIKGG